MKAISSGIVETLPGSAPDRPRVVVDTGPVNYLILVGQAHVLPALFGRIMIPEAVRSELTHPIAPGAVRTWLAHPPAWLSVYPDFGIDDPDLQRLGPGEQQAIYLATARHADFVVMDDRAGVAAARGRGLTVTGTLGLLDVAASRGLIDIADTIARLRDTSFRCRPEMLDRLLDRHRPP